MPIGGIISGIGSLAGGLFGSSAASDAAKAQADAAKQATELQKQEFQQITNNMLPFLQGGQNALGPLMALYLSGEPGQFGPSFDKSIASQVGPPPSPADPALRSQFIASPGYNYALQQSGNAIQNSAAGQTGALSGNMLRALQGNANGLASQDWWNFYNAMVNNYASRYGDIAKFRSDITGTLGNLAGAGQNAAANLGAAGQNYANAAGANLNLAGSANAAGILGSSNALSGAFNNLANNSSFTNAISQLFGGNSAGAGANTFNSAGGGGTGSAADNAAFQTFFPVAA